MGSEEGFAAPATLFPVCPANFDGETELRATVWKERYVESHVTRQQRYVETAQEAHCLHPDFKLARGNAD
jgi:hypothetical protein